MIDFFTDCQSQISLRFNYKKYGGQLEYHIHFPDMYVYKII